MILRRVIEHVRKQEWTAVLLDFLMVVAGILMAFQITEWNEERRERIRERTYLERIATELDRSITEIETAANTSQGREELGRLLIDSVDNSERVSADPGRFILALVKGGYTFSPVIRAHTFEEIKSAGDLDIFRDQPLIFDLTEFYTEVQGVAQWNYFREVKQTEYMKRAAGILGYEQISSVLTSEGTPEIAVADALAAHARMLARPAFIEWLPMVAERSTETVMYRTWLKTAQDLRARIRAILDNETAAGP